jgi:enoyl-CoA hydratase/carnithine racemase
MGRRERVSAQRAYQLGIVSEVVAPDRLRAAATELANKIALNPPDEVRRIKQLLWRALEEPA